MEKYIDDFLELNACNKSILDNASLNLEQKIDQKFKNLFLKFEENY